MKASQNPCCRLLQASLVAGLAIPGFALAQDKLTMMDADGNGRITSEEHEAGAKAMFDALDTNRDGNVSAMEMDVARPGALQGGIPAADKISVIDTDRDGNLSAAEHEAGSQSMFTQGDANKDGAIDAAEMEAAHAAMKRTLESSAAGSTMQDGTTQGSTTQGSATQDATTTDDTTQDDTTTDTPTPAGE